MEYIIAIVLVGLGVSALGMVYSSSSNDLVTGPQSTTIDSTKTVESPIQKTPYVEIQNPTGFVNTDGKPIQIGDYVGKNLILIEVMTYSCINCQRTFPYVNNWYETYKDKGLVVIGIHTPEFAFEKDISNVEKAMREFKINFPVVLDNEYATWRALGNRYWPRRYIIDWEGNIVYDHIGEGAYDETEEVIKQYLTQKQTI